MNINEYLEQHKSIKRLAHGYILREHTPRVVCGDGFEMSVQVSQTHYCTPRSVDAGEYTAVEVGYPSAREDLLMPYAEDADNPTDTVYGYVPVVVVDAVIEKHGGFHA